MYINKAIESVDRLYPNEYSLDEKYMWCDELSAKLMQELKREYGKVTLEADDNGDYLLPENISFEMIDRIFDGRYQLDKQDFRADGVVYLSGINRRIALPKRNRAKGEIDVIYLRRHEPIRRLEENISIMTNEKHEGIATYADSFIVSKKYKDKIRTGDMLNIKTESKIYADIPVFDVVGYGSDADSIEIIIPEGKLPPATVMSAEVTRIVTDKTVCDAPYDSMYIDYLLAKICYYQHDYESYNQHMTAFNGKYRDYEMWLKEREPLGDDGKIKNWW